MKIYADESQNPNTFTGKSENPSAFSDSKENPTEREKLRELHGKKKMEYILEYYRAPIIIALVAILVISYTVYTKLHEKTDVTSLTCVSIYFPDEIMDQLTTPFLTDYLELNPKKYDIPVDANLTVMDDGSPENAEYSYTSQMKVVAYISAGQMDLVFMGQRGFDYFSASGFLMNMEEVIREYDPELYDVIKDDLADNNYIVSDNTEELTKDPTLDYKAELEQAPFALDVSDLDLFRDFAGDQHLFLSLATNSGNIEASMQFLRYLYGLPHGDWMPEN